MLSLCGHFLEYAIESQQSSHGLQINALPCKSKMSKNMILKSKSPPPTPKDQGKPWFEVEKILQEAKKEKRKRKNSNMKRNWRKMKEEISFFTGNNRTIKK